MAISHDLWMHQISGTIKVIQETQHFPSGFSKREFVVTTEHEKFPQHLKFELVKEKCALLSEYQIGQQVMVSFDLRGNEFNGKYYVNLVCWQLQAQDASGRAQHSSAAETSTEELRQESNFDDDIPF